MDLIRRRLRDLLLELRNNLGAERSAAWQLCAEQGKRIAEVRVLPAIQGRLRVNEVQGKAPDGPGALLRPGSKSIHGWRGCRLIIFV